ncbi:hypothetical protein KI387_025676, partial [Taxus chinensis]
EGGDGEIYQDRLSVMETDGGIELRKNALRWKTLGKKAMVKGGSFDKNIEDFVEEVIART